MTMRHLIFVPDIALHIEWWLCALVCFVHMYLYASSASLVQWARLRLS